MSEVTAFLLGLLPGVIASCAAYYFQRAQKRRDRATEAHAAARKQESLLNLEVTMAAAKLSYSCAMAIKRGRPNGEVEEAVADYEAAKEAYYQFLNEQAADHLIK